LDVAETEEEYLVKASVPGINPDDLDITFTDKILTIKGEYKEEEEKEDVHYHLRERRFGSFSRRLRLPNTIKSDAIEAKYEDGVLVLHLPKTEEVKPKRITVQNGETPVLEGQASDMASSKN
jgi:HSP20 family protein